MATLNLPNITDSDLDSDKAKKQIKNYLYSLTEQLRYLLNNLDTDNFTADLTNQINASSKMSATVDKTKSELSQAISNATKLLTQEMGGYVVKRKGELLIMDTEYVETATKVWRFNLNGIGYSSQGIDGPYETAITMDGSIVADFITTGILSSILIKSDNYIAGTSGMLINLNNGTITSKNFNVDSTGKITAVDGIFSGILESLGLLSGHKVHIEDGVITLGDTAGYHIELNEGEIRFFNVNTVDLTLAHGVIGVSSINCNTVNGGVPITSANKDSYKPFMSTLDIVVDLTDSNNLDFPGSYNAASTIWCNGAFEPLTTSDFRLKKNILDFNLPIELFMELKPKQYEFKVYDNFKGINFGLIAQELEAAFKKHNLDPYAYNLIELSQIRSYLGEGQYVGDQVHRINYNNLISWLISIVQSQQRKLDNLEERLTILEQK